MIAHNKSILIIPVVAILLATLARNPGNNTRDTAKNVVNCDFNTPDNGCYGSSHIYQNNPSNTNSNIAKNNVISGANLEAE
jgi:hypothetical protein